MHLGHFEPKIAPHRTTIRCPEPYCVNGTLYPNFAIAENVREGWADEDELATGTTHEACGRSGVVLDMSDAVTARALLHYSMETGHEPEWAAVHVAQAQTLALLVQVNAIDAVRGLLEDISKKIADADL